MLPSRPAGHRALSVALACAIVLTSSPVLETHAYAPATPWRLEEFEVPPVLGQVTERWQPPHAPADRLLVYLQDAHTDPGAQERIDRLIEALRRWCGAVVVATEGAAGPYDVSPYTDLPDPESTHRVARVLLEARVFTGPEYAAVTRPHQVRLYGVEDEPLFLAHLRAHEQVMQQREARGTVAALRQAARRLARTTLPEAVVRLLVLREAARAASAPPRAFTRYATELVEVGRRAVPPHAVPMNLRSYARAVQLARHVDARTLQRERRQLLMQLWPALSADEQAALRAAAAAARRNLHALARYDQMLLRHAHARGLAPAADASSASRPRARAQGLRRSWQRYIAFRALARRIDPSALEEDAAHLHRAIEHALLRTPDQRAVTRLLRRTEQLEALLHLRLSPAEWHETAAASQELSWSALQAALGSALPVTAARWHRLRSSVEAAERFYALAVARDEPLARNTIGLLQHAPSVIFVGGGFHKKRVTARWREEPGVAYLVVTPAVQGSFDEERYHAAVSNRLPSMAELVDRLDRATLNPASSLTSSLPTELRIPAGLSTDSQPHTLTLPKRTAVLLASLILNLRSRLRRTPSLAEAQAFERWRRRHAPLAASLGLSLTTPEPGSARVLVSVHGLPASVDPLGTITRHPWHRRINPMRLAAGLTLAGTLVLPATAYAINQSAWIEIARQTAAWLDQQIPGATTALTILIALTGVALTVDLLWRGATWGARIIRAARHSRQRAQPAHPAPQASSSGSPASTEGAADEAAIASDLDDLARLARAWLGPDAAQLDGLHDLNAPAQSSDPALDAAPSRSTASPRPWKRAARLIRTARWIGAAGMGYLAIKLAYLGLLGEPLLFASMLPAIGIAAHVGLWMLPGSDWTALLRGSPAYVFCGVADVMRVRRNPSPLPDGRRPELFSSSLAAAMSTLLNYIGPRGRQQGGLVRWVVWPADRARRLPAEGIPEGVTGVILDERDLIAGVTTKTMNERTWWKLWGSWRTLTWRLVRQAGRTARQLETAGFRPLPDGIEQTQGHSRYASVEGEMIPQAAHLHGRGPVRVLRETIGPDGRLVTHESLHDVKAGLNGDLNGGKVHGQVLGTGPLGAWVGAASHYPADPPDEPLIARERVPALVGYGDTPILAEMVRFHTTQSMWYASVQLAYERAVAQSPTEEKPREEELTAWSVMFREAFRARSRSIYAGRPRPFDDVQDLRALGAFVEDVVAGMAAARLRDARFARLAPLDEQALRRFAQEATYAYLHNDLFRAMICHLGMTRGVEQTVETVSAMSGLEFGTRVYGSYGQGLTIVYDPTADPDAEQYFTASDLRAAIANAGNHALVLQLNSAVGEVVQLGAAFAHTRIYSFEEAAPPRTGEAGVKGELPTEEVARRWRPVTEIRALLSDETPQTDGNPVVSDHNHLPALVHTIHARMNPAGSAQPSSALARQNAATTDHFIHLFLEKLRRYESLQQAAQRAGLDEPVRPKAADLLLVGTENSATHMQLLKQSLDPYFEHQCHILAMTANEFARRIKQLPLGPETIVIITSRSGQTSQSVGSFAAANWLRHMTSRRRNGPPQEEPGELPSAIYRDLEEMRKRWGLREVFSITQSGVNDITTARGPLDTAGRSWVTEETFSLTDPSCLVPAAHQLITEIVLKLLAAVRHASGNDGFPSHPLGELTDKDLRIMRAFNEDLVTVGIPTTIGWGADGSEAPTALSHELEGLGRRIGTSAKEWGEAALLMALYVIVTVSTNRPLYQSVFRALDLPAVLGRPLDVAMYAIGVALVVWGRRLVRGDPWKEKIGIRTLYINAQDIFPFLKTYHDKLFAQAAGWFTMFCESGDALVDFLQRHVFKFGRGVFAIHLLPNGELSRQMQEAASEAAAVYGLAFEETQMLHHDRSHMKIAAQMGHSSGVQLRTTPRTIVFTYGGPGIKGGATVRLYSGAEKIFARWGTPDHPDAVAAFVRTRIDTLSAIVGIEKVLTWNAVEASTWRLAWWGKRVLLKLHLWPIEATQDFTVVHSTPSPVSPPMLDTAANPAGDFAQMARRDVDAFFSLPPLPPLLPPEERRQLTVVIQERIAQLAARIERLPPAPRAGYGAQLQAIRSVVERFSEPSLIISAHPFLDGDGVQGLDGGLAFDEAWSRLAALVRAIQPGLGADAPLHGTRLRIAPDDVGEAPVQLSAQSQAHPPLITISRTALLDQHPLTTALLAAELVVRLQQVWERHAPDRAPPLPALLQPLPETLSAVDADASLALLGLYEMAQRSGSPEAFREALARYAAHPGLHEISPELRQFLMDLGNGCAAP